MHMHMYVCAVVFAVYYFQSCCFRFKSFMHWSLPVDCSLTYLLTYSCGVPFIQVHWSYPMWQLLNVVACMNFGDGLNPKFRHTGHFPNF